MGRAYAGGGCGCPGQIWIGRVLWPGPSRRQGPAGSARGLVFTVEDSGCSYSTRGSVAVLNAYVSSLGVCVCYGDVRLYLSCGRSLLYI